MLKETMAVIAAAEKAADNKQAVAEGKAQKIIIQRITHSHSAGLC